MIGSEANASAIPEIGISQTRHGLSHHNGDPEQLRRLTMTDTFLVEQFSYFLEQLKTSRDQVAKIFEPRQPFLDGRSRVTWPATRVPTGTMSAETCASSVLSLPALSQV